LLLIFVILMFVVFKNSVNSLIMRSDLIEN
jgi:hypothetical protein